MSEPVQLWPAVLVCICGGIAFRVYNRRENGLVVVEKLECLNPDCELEIDLSR